MRKVVNETGNHISINRTNVMRKVVNETGNPISINRTNVMRKVVNETGNHISINRINVMRKVVNETGNHISINRTNVMRKVVNETDQIFNFGCDSNSYNGKPAFLVFVKQHLSIPDGQTIKFDDVDTNIGNHYNPLSGVFTTPKDGFYVMGCLIQAQAANYIDYKWMKNDAVISNGYVGKTENANSQTQSFVISLKRGDLISITKTGRWQYSW
ncbi:unnamed protein product [Mytilus edulis]|uniref:C1q domain-containing protein n=1 Tax=Mytilus edulis TaxID=6550 RepID=A0A8S3U1J7_MYTED|nr:unnamed protein product [Mytilus edulis]